MSDTDPKDPPQDQPDPPSDKDLQAEVDKWKALARKHESQSKANADAARKLAEREDADKSESERAQAKAAEAEQRAVEAERRAERLEVALEKAPDGLPIQQIRKLAKRLQGGTREELEADATELFDDFKPDTGAAGDKNGGDEGGKRRPKERLRPGAVAEAEPEENDPAKLADMVPRGW